MSLATPCPRRSVAPGAFHVEKPLVQPLGPTCDQGDAGFARLLRRLAWSCFWEDGKRKAWRGQRPSAAEKGLAGEGRHPICTEYQYLGTCVLQCSTVLVHTSSSIVRRTERWVLLVFGQNEKVPGFDTKEGSWKQSFIATSHLGECSALTLLSGVLRIG